MAALSEQEFRVKSDEALESARRSLLPLADAEGFEIELQNGVMQVVFEEPAPVKFVVSPNAPVRQVWVSAMSRSFKGDGVAPDATADYSMRVYAAGTAARSKNAVNRGNLSVAAIASTRDARRSRGSSASEASAASAGSGRWLHIVRSIACRAPRHDR